MIVIIASVFVFVLSVVLLLLWLVKKESKIYSCGECGKHFNLNKLYSIDDSEFICMKCIKKNKAKINRGFYND